jgi:hypothetical protein
MESEKIHGIDKKHYCDVLEMEYITIASEYARWSQSGLVKVVVTSAQQQLNISVIDI